MRQFVACGLLSLFVMGTSGCMKSVEIIAHRGASYLAPENTMASVMLGWQEGADVEVDVHLAKDNRIVVIHDDSTKRTAGADVNVADATSDELRKLDVGSFKSEKYAGEQIPFLDDIVSTIPPGRKLYIEIKCGREVLPYLRELLIRSGKMSQVVIIGFDLETVVESKELINVPTFWLKGTAKDKETEQWIPHDPQLAQVARSKGLDGLDVHYAGVTKEFAQAVKAAGLKLYVWTVDEPQEARRLIDLEVDGITTNRPGWLAGLVAYDSTAAPAQADMPANGASDTTLIGFPGAWTSPYRVDPNYPFQVVNAQGRHLFILNKTAWLYFGCKRPEAVLDRAVKQGVNVLRVSLEGRYYYETVGIELWPWGGTRDSPVWDKFDPAYWDEVERRIRIAGERGIGFDVVLYCTLRPSAAEVQSQRAYWAYALERLGKYANILTWEIANEYIENEDFQKQVAGFFHENDPYNRPICTSDGTTDDAAWPDRPWLDLAVNHTCTSSSERHDLKDWYLALACNTRSHGKPAFCNESGRENRHGNNDGIHRRKQGWLWCSAGGFWTWHSWDGCEGIDETDYVAPGQEFLKPMADFFRALPFWELSPNYTALTADQPGIVWATLARPDRSVVVMYLCTRTTGQVAEAAAAQVRLPAGNYRVTLQRPSDLAVVLTIDHRSSGSNQTAKLVLPDFTDDMVVTVNSVTPKQ